MEPDIDADTFEVELASGANGAISCERHCTVAGGGWGGEMPEALLPERRQAGAEQLQRYGLKVLLQLIKVCWNCRAIGTHFTHSFHSFQPFQLFHALNI